jgi:hypothetical protein
VTINWFVMAVALLQFCGSAYAWLYADWKMGVINGALGVTNVVFSTMAKA